MGRHEKNTDPSTHSDRGDASWEVKEDLGSWEDELFREMGISDEDLLSMDVSSEFPEDLTASFFADPTSAEPDDVDSLIGSFGLDSDDEPVMAPAPIEPEAAEGHVSAPAPQAPEEELFPEVAAPPAEVAAPEDFPFSEGEPEPEIGLFSLDTPEPEAGPVPAGEPRPEAPSDSVNAPRAAEEKAPRPETKKRSDSQSPRRHPSPKTAPRAAAASQRKKAAAPSGGKRPAAKKKKRASHFKVGVIAYCIVLLVLSIGLLAYLWHYVDVYQQEKDLADAEAARIAEEQAEQRALEKAIREAPQRTFMSWKSQLTTDYWTDLWFYEHGQGFEDRDTVYRYMAQKYDPAVLTAFRSLDYTAETPMYVLKNGDDVVARITLTGSETLWGVSQVEMTVEGHESASTRVVSGSRIWCNGIQLDQEYITESTSYFDYEPLRDSLVNPVTWDTYEVDGLFFAPELTVESPPGVTIVQAENGDYVLVLPEDEAGPYKNKAVNFVRSFLYYYMSGYNGTQGNLNAALAHLTPGTQAYDDLRNTYNGVIWNTAYANIDTSKTTVGDVLVWADNCYSVDVTYDADCTLNGQHIDYADDTMRIYFRLTNNGFIISNFETL